MLPTTTKKQAPKAETAKNPKRKVQPQLVSDAGEPFSELRSGNAVNYGAGDESTDNVATAATPTTTTTAAPRLLGLGIASTALSRTGTGTKPGVRDKSVEDMQQAEDAKSSEEAQQQQQQTENPWNALGDDPFAETKTSAQQERPSDLASLPSLKHLVVPRSQPPRPPRAPPIMFEGEDPFAAPPGVGLETPPSAAPPSSDLKSLPSLESLVLPQSRKRTAVEEPVEGKARKRMTPALRPEKVGVQVGLRWNFLRKDFIPISDVLNLPQNWSQVSIGTTPGAAPNFVDHGRQFQVCVWQVNGILRVMVAQSGILTASGSGPRKIGTQIGHGTFYVSMDASSSGKAAVEITGVAYDKLVDWQQLNTLKAQSAGVADRDDANSSSSSSLRVVEEEKEQKAKGSSSSKLVMPTKSANDPREYGIVTLDNGLECILVSDPTTQSSTAALDVHIGSWSDPEDIPGLAHFLEHMLFLGTQKYPEENGFHAFLNPNSGSTNAFTELEHTLYFFQVQPGVLSEALDRFAQFFIAPLYGRDAADRERKAVNNEHAKNRQSDDWRVEQVLRATANPKHPFARFATGCSETLDQPGVDIHARLVQFHQQNYSASNMKLAVLGRETLQQLEQYVRASFTPIVNQAGKPAFQEQQQQQQQQKQHQEAFPPNVALARQFWIETVKDTQVMSIVWPLFATLQLYREKPLELIAHLVGHEGAGSILSVLKGKKWATALTAGPRDATTEFTLFEIEILLTDEGSQHINGILDVVFAYIAMLRTPDGQQGAWQRVAAEFQAINKMRFEFKAPDGPGNLTVALATGLHIYTAVDVLTGPYLLQKIDIDLLQRVLQSMTRQRMRVHRILRRVPVDDLARRGVHPQTDKWYGTRFWSEPLVLPAGRVPAAAAGDKDAKFHIDWPVVNPFVAQDLRMKHVQQHQQQPSSSPPLLPLPPTRIALTTGVELWHKLDTVYGKPHAHVMIQLSTPVAYASPVAAVLTALYTALVVEDLNEVSYMAQIGHLSYSLMHNPRGLVLIFSGLNDKLTMLAVAVLERMRRLVVDATRFEIFRREMLRGLHNTAFDAPFEVGLSKATLALSHRAWSDQHKIAALESSSSADVTPDKLQKQHMPALLDSMQCQMLVMGNMTADEAKRLASGVQQLLGIRNQQQQQQQMRAEEEEQRTVALTPSPRRHVWQIKHANAGEQNSAAVLVLQLGPDTVATSACTRVVHGFVQEPFFDTLRTKRQLGYIVRSQTYVLNRCTHWLGIIQSSDKTAPFLDEQMQRFLVVLRGQLALLDDAVFQQRLGPLIQSMSQPDATLFEESMRCWDEIQHRTYVFDRVAREVAELKQLTLAKFLDFWDTRVSPASNTRRALAIHVFGNNNSQAARGDGKKGPLPPPPPDMPRMVLATDEQQQQQQQQSVTTQPIYLTTGGRDDDDDGFLFKWQQSMMLFPLVPA